MTRFHPGPPAPAGDQDRKVRPWLANPGENCAIAAATQQPTQFSLHVPDDVVADLRERLARTRFPDQVPGALWAYGTDVNYMCELVAYWRAGFDWRAQEAQLNAFPQHTVPLHGIDLHFL